MAKRKRLSPVKVENMTLTPPLETKSMSSPLSPIGGAAPISQVTGDAAQQGALAELSDVIGRSVDAGLMIQSLPVAQIIADHLMRDRVVVDDEDMTILMNSIASRGQASPIEVVWLDGTHEQARFGLISGWRRLMALRKLLADTDDSERYGRINALVRKPETASDAYVAMVEENEIRVGLSYFERARIVVRAAEAGVYPSQKQALKSLFSATSRAKRSKIGSFVSIARDMEERLVFPTHVSERLGLRLAKAFEDKAFGTRLSQVLQAAKAQTPAQEQEAIEQALSQGNGAINAIAAKPASPTPRSKDAPIDGVAETVDNIDVANIRVSARGDIITLSGVGVNAAFKERLLGWVRSQD